MARAAKPQKSDDPRKAALDALLLALPGTVAKKIGGLEAWFVGDRMYACLSAEGVGLRVASVMATELQFSRDGVSPFQPAGMPPNREWVQLKVGDAAGFAKEAGLFAAAHAFVKSQAR